MPHEKSTLRQQAHFDSIATTYIEARRDPRHLLIKELIWRTFFSGVSMDLPVQPRVLEAMCGEGDGKRILSKFGHIECEWTGFDYSAKMVEAAKLVHPESRVFQADATTYVPERDYDLILMIGGLHHVFQQARQTAANLSKGLKIGGYLIAFEPTHSNPLIRAIRRWIYKSNPLFDEDTERDFHIRELHDIFRASGLVHCRDLNFGLIAYILFYNPDAFPMLNRGPLGLVKMAWAFDKLFAWNAIGRYFSFGTLSLWRALDDAGIDK